MQISFEDSKFHMMSCVLIFLSAVHACCTFLETHWHFIVTILCIPLAFIWLHPVELIEAVTCTKGHINRLLLKEYDLKSSVKYLVCRQKGMDLLNSYPDRSAVEVQYILHIHFSDSAVYTTGTLQLEGSISEV